MGKLQLAIVVPVFNEEDSLMEFWNQLTNALDDIGLFHEIIFVNDGSYDGSLKILNSFQGHGVKVVDLTLNAGHMSALDAGYREADADWVVTMDSDLQHPPSVIASMIRTAQQSGVDVVYATRSTRFEDSYFKRLSASVYYKLLRNLSGIPIHKNAADFRLISNRVLDIIKALPPGAHVFRLLIPGLGFPEETFSYVASERIAGESKYNFGSMLRLAIRSIVSFSVRPLIFSIYIGLFFSLVSIIGLGYSLLSYVQGNTIPGWASLSSAVLLLFGILFFILGILGTYLGEIWHRTSGMPDYFLNTPSKSTDGSNKEVD